jgi:tetratricopeptide (TPR) repeat protein
MGICFGRLVTMDAPSARPKRSMNWHSVLWHEFVHVVTLQKTGNRMPRWLSEGISVFEETERDPAWGQRLDPQFKAILDEGELPGLSELESYFTQARSAVHLMFGYFSAGEFVGHYVETYGFDALRDSLDAISAGKKAEVALAEAAGATLDEIDKGFREFLTERLAPLENLPAIRADAALEVDVMDDDTSQTLTERGWGASQSVFTDRMKAAEEARAEERWEDLERELRAAHEAFPDYMAADAPLRQLIRLHERRGERDKLKEALAEEIAWNPTDYDARARLAALLREDEQWERLRAVSLGALGIDPYEVGMRRTLIDARLKTGDDAGALSALDQLVRLDIARATDYRLQRLDILIRVEDWSRARQEAVQLLEDVPHYWEAQQRLLRIVDRDGVKEGRGADRHR